MAMQHSKCITLFENEQDAKQATSLVTQRNKYKPFWESNLGVFNHTYIPRTVGQRNLGDNIQSLVKINSLS